ncbi:MAG: DUF169 domain-containing protein [Firmicutes bacterium]|nr:DUF169 domain-containing protein [Bacillota bacterium]
MPTVKECNEYGRKLEELLLLRYAPIAMKLLAREEQIPEGAVRPKKDLGVHMALCQAFAMVRRQRVCLALLKEDHWCVWPLISFGLVEFREGEDYYDKVVTANFVEDPEKAKEFFAKSYPRLGYGSCAGMVMAPLATAGFVPDLVLVYLRPAQLRSMLMSVKYKTGELLECKLDSVDSCVHSTIPVIKSGKYNVTVPDPGEYERGLTDEDEMIFSAPGNRLAELVEGLTLLAKRGFGYRQLFMEMNADFPRPLFYNNLFKMWGLDEGEIWKR